jgi:hypothetical protein
VFLFFCGGFSMTKWDRVLSSLVGVGATMMFVDKELSIEEYQKHFRVGKDRIASGQVRRLIRTHGAALSRRIGRKALKRRNLI